MVLEVRSESKIRISLTGLKKTTKKILRALGQKKAGLSVLLVDDPKMRTLNRRYLGANRTTDVIAFEGCDSFLGDIVISLPTAKRQAKRYDHSFTYELYFYLCHGILHLMGYRDKTAREAKKMERKQERILSVILRPSGRRI